MGFIFSKLNQIFSVQFNNKIVHRITSSVMSQETGFDSQKIWKSIGTFNLIEEDKSVILWCDLDHINPNILRAALYLLKQQYLDVKGLQTIVSLNDIDLLEPIESGFPFVQLVSEGLDHWIVVSNIMCERPEKEVKIYDSKHYPKHIYSDQCKQTIKKSMNNIESIKVIVPQVSQIRITDMSGLYAIAFAQMLCSGEDPSNLLLNFLPGVLREHLCVCLDNGLMTSFPLGNTCRAQTIVERDD